MIAKAGSNAVRRMSRPGISEAEWDVRVRLAACYRLAAKVGWTDLIYTHIPARVPGPQPRFLLNS